MFSIDGKFYDAISKVADLVILNLLFLICCIPVVTIGAATTALYGVTKKMAKKNEGYVIRIFLKQFKENFRQSTVMWLLILIAGIVLFVDLYIGNMIQNSIARTMFSGIMFMGIFIVLFVFLYAMALQSTFENTIKNTIKNAFFMGIGYFPWTLLIIFVSVSPFVSLTFMGRYWYTELLVMLLIWFAGNAYINAYIFNHIFEKHI